MSLQHAVLKDALVSGGHDCTLETFDQLPSTSEYLALQTDLDMSLAHVVACDWQTAGNGRRGKSWDSAAGNITLSVKCLAPVAPAQVMGLSLVTGISVAEALQSTCDLGVELKWPNDVILEDRKLCGLLTELQSHQGANTTSVIAGIGINVLENESVKQLGIGGISLSEVCTEQPQRELVIANVVTALLSNYQEFYNNGWAAFAKRWSDRDYLAGKSVTVLHDKQEQTADVLGLDDDGALRISNNGQVQSIYSGDVSVRLSPGVN